MTAWGITDGSAGMMAQVRALAAAIGVTPEMKKIVIKPVFAALPNMVHSAFLKPLIIPYGLSAGSDSLAPPYPDLVISCGRRAAMVAMGLKRDEGMRRDGDEEKTHPFLICIQDPQMSARHFDLVIAMQHDAIKGPNVIKTRFALHNITQDALNIGFENFAGRFSQYPKPLTAVLLGGSTNKYTLDAEGMAKIVIALQRVLKTSEGSLLITPSRRTGHIHTGMLRALGSERSYVYDGGEPNPYLGMLALADRIIVTNDSVNMMSEAAATGKPIYILPLPGHTGTKPARFADMLIAEGIARPLGGALESWTYTAGNEMETLAAEVKRRLNWSSRA